MSATGRQRRAAQATCGDYIREPKTHDHGGRILVDAVRRRVLPRSRRERRHAQVRARVLAGVASSNAGLEVVGKNYDATCAARSRRRGERLRAGDARLPYTRADAAEMFETDARSSRESRAEHDDGD